MRTNRLILIVLALALCSLGTYLLLDSVRDTSQFAEAGVLIGGTLMGLSLFPLITAFEQHSQLKAPARHVGHRSRVPS